MKKIKRLTLSFMALLIVSGLAMAAPVSARGSGSDKSTNSSSGDAESADDTASATSSNKTENEAEVHNLTTKLRQQGEAEVETHHKDSSLKTASEREKVCTARKANLTRRMANSVSWAKKHKAVIDSAYTRVKAFHDSKNLDVANYAALTAAVDTAQSSAQTSIDALQSLDISVDCTSQTVATSVSTFQQSVKNTRDSLKAYRAALVNLISSLKGASAGTSTDSSANSTAQ